MHIVIEFYRTRDVDDLDDAMTITDAAVAVLYAGAIEADASNEERQRS